MSSNIANSVAQGRERIAEDRDIAGKAGKCKSDQLNFF